VIAPHEDGTPNKTDDNQPGQDPQYPFPRSAHSMTPFFDLQNGTAGSEEQD
jgi:hypothetical protein